MRNSKQKSGFFPCLFINILMNIEGLLPAVILLILHFWIKISVWWSVGAFIAWIIYLIMWMVFISWAGRCGAERDLPKKTKIRIQSEVRIINCDLPASAGENI